MNPELALGDPDARAKLEFLRATGIDEVEHDSHVPFLTHLVATSALLQRWQARRALVDAGLFHSVYGTEYFSPELERMPSRASVQDVIGSEAERLAWLWCNIERESIRPQGSAGWLASSRFDGTALTMSEEEVRDLVDLWAADTVEQIERMAPEEREFAAGLDGLIHLASEPARQACARLREVLPVRRISKQPASRDRRG